MQIQNRIIEVARETAKSGFSAMAQHIIAVAGENLRQMTGRSSFERSALAGAYDFLNREGGSFAKRLSNFYSDYLDRAMQTMYVDLRASLTDLSAEHLTLIDDETMDRQIEVDRLVHRLRDADPENLGRLNIMISQLHGEHDVRERENPFRPYLLARTLHNVLEDMVKDSSVRSMLFEHLAKAMEQALPSFFRAIRDVFEMSGVHAQLVARPSMLSGAQRNILARQAMQAWPAASMQSAVPGMQAESGQYPLLPQLEEGHEFQNLIRELFRLPKAGRRVGAPHASIQSGVPVNGQAFQPDLSLPRTLNDNSAVASARLVARLGEIQQAIAAGRPIEGQLPLERNQLFGLREAIEPDIGSDQEKMTIEVIGLLFEFILSDRFIPERLRDAIGRLQVPFLKATMLMPELLHQSNHPARQLLNRLGTMASSVEPGSSEMDQTEAAIGHIVDAILAGFEEDTTIFAEQLKVADEFVATRMQRLLPEAAVLVDALNEAEMLCAMVANIARSMNEVLETMVLDFRIKDFILNMWSRVLAYAAYAELFEHDDEVHLPQLDIVPDLIWSVQPLQDQSQRTALMRFLPGLVTNIKKYLQATPLSPAELQQALDQLVAVHTDVLRTSQAPVLQAPLALEEIHDRFGAIKIDVASWDSDELAPVRRNVVEAALAKHQVSAQLHVDDESLPSFGMDSVLLTQIREGTPVEFHLETCEGRASLVGFSRKASLYAFQERSTRSLLVFSSNALLKAFRQSACRLDETLPLFDRAVEALVIEAENG